MKKVRYDSLAVEVTRRCNMACAHCLRGCAENADITDDIIEKALENVEYIDSVTFTGGEPTLNVHAIRKFLDVCKENDIGVGNFYVVTNGKEVTSDFLCAMIEWYCYCREFDGEYCGVALSQDKYHDAIDHENVDRLRALSFFREDDKKVDWDKFEPMRLGRARDLGYTRPAYRSVPDVIDEDDHVLVYECTVTLTVDGLYLPFCDYEYAEAKTAALGSVYDNEAYVNMLLNGMTDEYEERIQAA